MFSFFHSPRNGKSFNFLLTIVRLQQDSTKTGGEVRSCFLKVYKLNKDYLLLRLFFRLFVLLLL